MALEQIIEKWSGQVTTVTIGATAEEGGTRTHSIQIGGESTLPFLFPEGAMPHKPQIAFEIWDSIPTEWPQELMKHYKDVAGDPFAWAQKCVKSYHASLLCVRLQGAHPDSGNKTPKEEAAFVAELIKKVGVPLILIGCGDDEKDNQILPLCSEALKGERC
ncbi:MAG: acetyl-CoA decarbonylase/synthase complex subunit delta, partial [Candidatus Omnitrophica bacterium]|nr:acetyl-CoA decarbonylase/synthase complex subunit delta [Candidatus Omnitrophota bacterium]